MAARAHKASRAKPYWYGELVGVGFAAVGAPRGVTVTEALRLATNKIDLKFEFIVGVRTSVDPTSETSIDVA